MVGLVTPRVVGGQLGWFLTASGLGVIYSTGLGFSTAGWGVVGWLVENTNFCCLNLTLIFTWLGWGWGWWFWCCCWG